jgi:hypothetical protein
MLRPASFIPCNRGRHRYRQGARAHVAYSWRARHRDV